MRTFALYDVAWVPTAPVLFSHPDELDEVVLVDWRWVADDGTCDARWVSNTIITLMLSVPRPATT